MILYIVDNKPELDNEDICGLVLQEAKCEELVIEFETDIEIRELQFKEEVPPQNNLTDSSEDLHIVHLTDIHVDFQYMHKGKADCPEPSCCRIQNTLNSALDAGYWGDYRNCDSPVYAIEDALRHIKEKHSVCKTCKFE